MAGATTKPAQEAPPSAAPVQPPSSKVMSSLADEDQVMLTRLLVEPAEYIADPRLDVPGADVTLFGVETKFIDKAGTRFTRPTSVVPEKKARGGRIPTLTTEQEQILFQRFNYARKQIVGILDAHSGKRLSAAKTRELIAWGHRAVSIRSEIVQFNLPLVLAMAKRTRLNGIDYNELISEGNVALLRSVEKFDPGRGFKFSTYSCRAILKAFSRVAMRTSRYRGRFPVEYDPAMEKSDFLDRKRLNVEIDCVDELKRILVENTADLNTVEQRVIKERFALVEFPGATDEQKPKTLEQVGQLIGVTKERVRQIQNRALRKIRSALEHEYLVA
jgi:RNA polymerase primary sigma factor